MDIQTAALGALGQQSTRRAQYSIDEVEAALCVWEWMLENHKQLDTLFDGYGSVGMRSTAMQAGVFVEKCYTYDATHCDGMFTGDDSFDWEFVPLICREINWSVFADNNQYGDGCYEPDVTAFMAVLVARKALDV